MRREVDGLIGDLRLAVLIEDRSVGRVTVRAVELALGLAPALNDEEVMSKERLAAMLAAAIGKSPDLKQQCLSVRTVAEHTGEEARCTSLLPVIDLINHACDPNTELWDATSEAGEGAGDA